MPVPARHHSRCPLLFAATQNPGDTREQLQLRELKYDDPRIVFLTTPGVNRRAPSIITQILSPLALLDTIVDRVNRGRLRFLSQMIRKIGRQCIKELS